MLSLAPRIIAGLGNPGERYANTRHNVGFMVVEDLARRAGVGRWKVVGPARVCQAKFAGQPVILAEPLTFMNASGAAILPLLSEYEMTPQDLLLISDDFNLPFGRIRIRARGSAAGHNGLESIFQSLGTEEVARLRLGVGEEEMPEDKARFVLADFPPDRRRDLEEMVIKAGDAVNFILSEGVSKAMSVYNA
jgi:peptidyl-tRNA hydrolase, PTH1 family